MSNILNKPSKIQFFLITYDYDHKGPKYFKNSNLILVSFENNIEEKKKIEHKVLSIKPGHQHDVQ